MQKLLLLFLSLILCKINAAQKSFNQPDTLKGFSIELGTLFGYQAYTQLSPLPYNSFGPSINIQYLSSSPSKEKLYRFIGGYGFANASTEYANYSAQTGYGSFVFHQLYTINRTDKLNFKLGAEEELTYIFFYNPNLMNAGFMYNGYASIAPKFQVNSVFNLNPKTKFNCFSSISASVLSFQVHPVYGNVGNFPVQGTEQAVDLDVATIGGANIINFEIGFNWLRPTKNGLSLRYNWKAFWGNEQVSDAQIALHNITFGLFLNTKKPSNHE